jgi:EpsI family protein
MIKIGPVRRRGLLVAGVMFAGAGLATGLRPSRLMSDTLGVPRLEDVFPVAFGGWRVDTSLPVILPAPDVQAQLDKLYNEVLARTYVNADGVRVMLSVAYGGDQSDATSAHRPEVCYPAQGFAITENFADTVRVAGRDIPVRRLMSHIGGRHEPITYWIVVGDRIVTTGIGQKLAQMRFGLRNIIADGLLMRVSTIDADMAHGHRVQSAFLAELGSALDDRIAARVLGACPESAAGSGHAC